MKLERFRERDKKRIGIVLFTIACIFLIVGIFLYKTFALFEVKKDFNIIEGTVQDLGDVYFAYYLDDKASASAPIKESNYVFDEINSSCNNGATIEWNYEKWAAVVSNLVSSRTKCYLRFKTQHRENLLNGADPVLSGSLIPVNIADNGTITRVKETSKWYSYEDKKWANAIILKDESQTYNVGEVIPESAVESYFVWIPRYRYKIFNDGNYPTRGDDASGLNPEAPQTIEIVFENKDTIPSTGTSVGSWLTHPAFTAFDSNGMWVGKFETSKGSGNNNVRNADQIQIKSNVESWRNIHIANAFYTSYDYKRDLDSHMMKNTEWGAVSYLQHSKYGSQTSVRINNNSSFITGYAANNEPTCGYIGTNEECNRHCNDGSCNVSYPNSVLASTTGNVTGIYDMSGGAWEYMISVMVDQNGKPMSGRDSLANSGFNGTLGCPTCDNDTSGKTSITDGYEWPNEKYYDTYVYSDSDQQYQRRILGDATGEMGPFGVTVYTGSGGSYSRAIGSWYATLANFVNSYNSWFQRGGDFAHGLDAGVFAFNTEHGRNELWIGFRVVLSPQ